MYRSQKERKEAELELERQRFETSQQKLVDENTKSHTIFSCLFFGLGITWWFNGIYRFVNY